MSRLADSSLECPVERRLLSLCLASVSRSRVHCTDAVHLIFNSQANLYCQGSLEQQTPPSVLPPGELL